LTSTTEYYILSYTTLFRSGQRRRQRDGAAHARPAPDHPAAPAGAARDLRGPAVDRPDQEGDDEVPREADDDHRRADGRRVADDLDRKSTRLNSSHDQISYA